jgi:hypothetical protein
MLSANHGGCSAAGGVDSAIRNVGADAVKGMLPDFRFVLGAILAIAVLAVTGVGLVTSVRLVQEARLGPLGGGRSLAYAEHSEWNQFYDPDSARRFEGPAGKTEAPVAEARPETAIAPTAPPVVAPVVVAPAAIAAGSPQERTASIPARPAPEIAPFVADDKMPVAEPPHADPPQSTEMKVTIAAPPAEPAPAPAVPDAPASERVASTPALPPAADLVREKQGPAEAPAQERAQPQAAGAAPQDSAPPTPRARPKVKFRKKTARTHIRRVAPATQQTWQNPSFPTSGGTWPGYDNQFTGATAKKNAGSFNGTSWYRPQ